jgi:hypothetical protein
MVTQPMTPLLAKTFSIESRELWFQLQQTYFQEELLRPVFVWGVGLGTLLLLVALLFRDDRMKMVSLILLGAAGLAVIPYLQIREKVARTPHPRAEPSGKVTRLREEAHWVFVSMAGLALGTAIWGARTRYGGALTIATLIAGAGATGTGLWLAAHDAGAMHFSPRKAAPAARPSAEAPPRSLRPEPSR